MSSFVGDDGPLLLLRAITAQAVYDFQTAVNAGAMNSEGRVTNPRQRTVKATGRKSGFILGAGNSALVNTTMGDLQGLSRCVTSDKWVASMQSLTGVPVNSAKGFRMMAISRSKERMNCRFRIHALGDAGFWRDTGMKSGSVHGKHRMSSGFKGDQIQRK
jgi:hypothetical protein